MNILFLLRLWPVYGGGETVTRVLANEFVKRGHKVSVMFFKRNDVVGLDVHPSIEEIVIEGTNVGPFDDSSKDAFHVNKCLGNYLKENSCDVIINQWFTALFIKNIVQDYHVPILSVFHMNVFMKPYVYGHDLKSIVKRMFYRKYTDSFMRKRVQAMIPLINESTKWVFLSESYIDEFLKYSNGEISFQKLTAIGNPSTFSGKMDISEYGIKENILLFVGRVHEPHKRMSLIIKSWSLLEKKYPDWKLVFVGDGPDLTKTKELVRKLRVLNVEFMGYQSPESFYKQAKIFVMTSHHEGWGMTLVEAQKNLVVPVVMDSFSAVHNIITSGENGIITDNGNVREYAKTLGSLMDDKNRLYSMAILGQKTAERFNVECIADQWEQLFSEVIMNK